MNKYLSVLGILGMVAVSALFAAPANAQAARTWISGVGDDVNPCSRTAPCKTFAGAISKTAVNGEINCLDPGGFGGVTITKSITFDCTGTKGSILVAATNGVTVNAAGAVVILRGLEFVGNGSGIHGISISAASQVTIENCAIWGFTQNAINVSTGALVQVYANNVLINQANKAVFLTASAGAAVAYLTNVRAFGVTTNGLEASTNSLAVVRSSVFIGSIAGTGVITSAASATIDIADSLISANNIGLKVGVSGSKIQMTGLKVFANNVSTSVVAGGSLVSGNDNKIDPIGVAPGGTIPNQ